MSYRQASYDEPLLREFKSGATYEIPGTLGDAGSMIPDALVRKDLNIQDVAEYDVVRHFTRLSQMNYGVDLGFYPLGSCTMKFNPKYADLISSMSQFRDSHPLADESLVQGNLRIMYELQEYLKAISDMDAVSLQPLAGAHGEFSGILIVRKYFQDRGDLEKRTEIIIPDSAHGTNPASAAMAGFDVVEVPSGKDGTVDVEALKGLVSEKTAAFMITNPNTLGIFEHNIGKIDSIFHEKGALLYYDGANFNAIMGHTSPGLMGFDIVHFNLHKTFATPHGGGGPGSGPIAVKERLREYLPVPVVEKKGNEFHFNYSLKNTIGKVSSFHGSFGVLLRAWAYITGNGRDGLTESSSVAVLNTNYIAHKLSSVYGIPFKKQKMHELVISSASTGKRAMDIAKYVLDAGMHPPTVYFPLILKEAMMIEPTETVSRRDLDEYCRILIEGAGKDEEELHKHPTSTPVGRIDEVRAARDQKLNWRS
ncbi:MAG: aminomethyl-transferring glycine dehydrogenase subunit GcvPB [Thermoplasmataceae archaeon]